MRQGMWLMLLPAIAFGLFNVLVPLRLDELGAGAARSAPSSCSPSLFESAVSPLVGRDRRPPRRDLAGPDRPGRAAGWRSCCCWPRRVGCCQ